jgi:hypothetical protein
LKYTIALLYDIDLTKGRFNDLISKKEVPPFKSKVSEIVKRKIESEYLIVP